MSCKPSPSTVHLALYHEPSVSTQRIVSNEHSVEQVLSFHTFKEEFLSLGEFCRYYMLINASFLSIAILYLISVL